MEFIPYVSINPTRLSFYQRPEGYFPKKSKSQLSNEYNLSNTDSHGIISGKARSRIITAIDWLLYLAKNKKHFSEKSGKYFNFKLTFVTLDLASKQIHTDVEIKEKLLNHFLIEAKKKWSIDKYLWRAESQKNGNIHFHVLTDKFIPWDELRHIWNRIQNKLGYVDRYAVNQRKFHKKGFTFRPELAPVWNYYHQKKAYKKGMMEGWQDPNSTDIHSVKKVKRLSLYIAKYCTKNDIEQKKEQENKQLSIPVKSDTASTPTSYELSKKLKTRIIEGKLWRLSQSLSKFKSAIDLCDSKVEMEFNILANKFANAVKHYDYNTNIYLPVATWSQFVKNALYSILLDYIKEVSPT